MPAGGRLPSALRSTRPGRETCPSCPGRRSAPEDLSAAASPVTGQLARFALAAIDGAFVACQADREATLEQLLQPLTPSLAASRRALLARAG
jgi:hypothetical protein